MKSHAVTLGWIALMAAVPPVSAEKGADKKATELQSYSDKEKKMMAEIGTKPEVQAEVEQAWADKRREDILEAFQTNTDPNEIYDNPIVNDYVNSLGQKLAPKDSPNLYAFRLVHDPLPKAHALTTGTVYVSTGLVSMLDNEAQLAYVLGHEIAHIERGHGYAQVRNAIIEEKLLEAKQIQARKKRSLFGALGAIAGAAIGGAAGGDVWAARGAAIGAVGGYVTGAILSRNKLRLTEWETVHEDEADEVGLALMLDQKYDAREIPKAYARLERLVTRDERMGLGFMGSKQRVRERTAHIQRLLGEAMKPQLDALLASGGLVGGGPDFAVLMSSLRRDNGILALQYDLFAMAKDNLEEAANLRSNDPRVHHYLGKVVSLTAKTEGERQQASQHFLTAIRYDLSRGSYAEPHLQRALTLIKQGDSGLRVEIQDELKAFVTIYQRTHEGHLPPNMHIIYDYFTLAGDTSWFAPPFSVVQTRYIDWPIASGGPKPAPKPAGAKPKTESP